MHSEKSRLLEHLAYEKSAQAYLKSLPLEHFMEAPPQATQRKITLESFDLIHARRPEVQLFNELLLQYPHPTTGEKRKVVPDNMVVVHPEPIHPGLSYNLPLAPARPLVVLEYVSKSSKRKDYEDNMVKYEHDLKVPYYLLFYPDNQELTLYRHNGRKYVSVKPDADIRLPIPELELAVAIHDDWVRYWFRGELLPLPADLQRDLDETRLQRDEARKQRDAALGQRDAALGQRDAALGQRDDLIKLLEDERRARAAAEEELARLRALQKRQGK